MVSLTKMKFSAWFIPIFALFWGVGSSSQQHLVCKHIDDVFPESGAAETQQSHRVFQGPPGKMGPAGIQGERGLPGKDGPPGEVEYSRVYDAMDVKLTDFMSAVNSTTGELNTKLSKLLSEWEEMKPIFSKLKRKAKQEEAAEADCTGKGGIVDSGKCFTVYLLSKRGMNHEEANTKCLRHGALLAEIHDRTQQRNLYNFVLTKMPATGLTLVDVALGMEYKRSTRTLQYRSGKEVEFGRLDWHPEHPTTRDSLGIRLRSAGGPNVGLHDTPKSHGRHGVICEKDI